MSDTALLNGLLNLLGIAVVLGILYGPIQGFIADAVRQRLFELRDGIFDAAARGEISFDDPDYGRFREFVNSLLRNAHEVTIWRCLTLTVVGIAAKTEAPTMNPLGLSDSAPEIIKEAQKKVFLWFGALLWLRSPMFIALTAVAVIAIPVFLIVATTSASARRLPRRLFSVLGEAVREDAAFEVMLNRHDKRIA